MKGQDKRKVIKYLKELYPYVSADISIIYEYDYIHACVCTH